MNGTDEGKTLDKAAEAISIEQAWRWLGDDNAEFAGEIAESFCSQRSEPGATSIDPPGLRETPASQGRRQPRRLRADT